MVDYLITPASGTAAISDSSGISTTPGANKLWASGTNLYWSTTQIDGGGGGTIGGSLSSGKLAIGTATDTIGNFVDALTEDNSIYIGANPASTTSTAEYNLAIGKSAMSAVTTGDSNTAVGARALLDLTEGSTNTAVGYNAGENVTTGGSNTLIGYDAGKGADTESNNVALGAGALRAAANSWNTAIGVNAARVYTGHSIVALGYEAGSQNVSGGGNTILGNVAFYNHAGGASNTVIGSGSMLGDGTNKPSSSSNNTSIGVNTMKFTSGSQSSVAIGNGALAGAANNTSNYNVAIGYKAASGTTGGDNNVAIGYESLMSVSSGYHNTAVGYQAGYDITSGHSNVLLGSYAGTNITDLYENTIIGFRAGQSLASQTTHGRVTLVGYQAGYSMTGTDVESTVMVGWNAGYNYKATKAATLVGGYAGYNLSGSGDASVAIGIQAGYGAATGFVADNCVFIGNSIAETATASQYDVFIGGRAGGSLGNSSVGNTVIGFDGGRQLGGTANAQYNTILGYQAGYYLGKTDGGVTGVASTGNVVIGKGAGIQNRGGNKNVYIGFEAGPPSATSETNKLYINNAASSTPLIGGDFSSGGTLTFTASGNAPYSTVFKHSQVSTNGEDGIAIDAREPRLSLINRRDTDETWKIMANNSNSSLQIVKDSQLVKAIFSPDNGGGVTFGIAAAAATSGIAIAQGASMSFDNTTTNRIYRTGSDLSYISNELHYFNNPVKVDGNIATASLGQALEFADRDDLLIRGTASFDMEITAPQDVAFGIDSDNNETTHAFLWKKDTKTPSSAGTELMRLNELGRLGIGTTAPDQSLHVKSADNYLAKFESTDGIAEIRVQDNTKYTRLLTVGSQYKIMPNDGVELMVLDGSANTVAVNGNLNTHNIRPLADNTYALGTPGLSWTELHLEDYIELNAASATTNHAGTNRFWVSGTTPFFNNQVIQVGAGDPLSIAAGRFSQGAASQAGILMSDYGAATNSASNAGTVTYLYWDNNTSTLHPRNLSMGGTFTMGGHGMDDILISSDSASTSNTALVTAGYVNANGGGGGIGGSITDNQVAVGASTSDEIEGSANLTYDGTNLSLAANTDVTATIGNAVVGYNFSDYASFSHYDQRANTGGYALLQSDVGITFLNAAATKSIRFRINNADKMTMDADGKLGIGTTAPDTSLHTTGDITVQGGDIFFGNTDKIKLTRGGTTYFQALTSGGSAAGLQALGVMVNHAYGSTPQRATITIGETGSKPTAAAGYGYIWVKNTAPNTLYFTDDAGTDHQLGAGGTAGANLTLSNLDAGTAINSSLVSDADNTDDLGSSAVSWRKVYTKEYNGFDTNIAQWAAGVSANADIHYSIGVQAFITSISAAGGIVTGIQTQQAPSDSKVKDNVKKYTTGLSLIDKLEPKTWNWNDSKYGDTTKTNYGLMADDVEAINSSFTKVHSTHETHGEIKGFSEEFTNQYNMALLQAVKDLSAKNDALEARIVELEGKL